MKVVKKLMLPLLNGERRLRFVTVHVCDCNNINTKIMDIIIQTENFKVAWSLRDFGVFPGKEDSVDFEQLAKDLSLNLID